MDSSKKNLGFMAFSTYFRLASQFIIFLVLARRLGAEQFGYFSYLLSICTIILLPVNYGFGMQLMREAAYNSELLTVKMQDMIKAKTCLALIVLILCAVYSLFGLISTMFWLMLTSLLFESYTELYNYALRSQGLFRQEARLALITSLFQFIIVIAAATAYAKIYAVIISYFIARLISYCITLKIYGQSIGYVKGELNINLKNVVISLRSGFPYAADMAVTTMNNSVDIVLIKNMIGIHSVGVYQAGMRLMMGGATPATVVSNVYLPRIASLDIASIEYKYAVKEVATKMIVLGAAISISLTLFDELIVSKLFGSQYSELAGIFNLFAAILMLKYLAACLGVNLTAAGYQSVRAIANIVYLIVFIVASLILMPYYNLTGVLLSTILATSSLILLYGAYAVLKKLPIGLSIYNVVILLIVVIIYLARLL